MKCALRLALATAIVVFVAISLTVTASAHSLYVSSSPANNSTVAAEPSTVKGYFDSGINPKGTSITVAGLTGRADQGDGHVDLNDPNRQTLVVSLKPGLGPGKYTVSWTTVAADDGDTANGTWTFTVAAPAARVASAPASAATIRPAALPRTGGVPGTAAIVAAALLAVGGLGVRRLTSRDGDDRQTG